MRRRCSKTCGLFVLPATLLVLLTACETPGGGGGFGQLGVHQGDEEIWAINCLTLQGFQRLENAQAYAAALKKVAGLKPKLVQIISDADGTSVYYGRYRRIYGTDANDEPYRPDPRTDLETIRGLMMQLDGQNVWPFMLASMEMLPTFQSEHPEWNLKDATGYWALHVGVFYNTETLRSRRSAAEEYCRVLRNQGEEAYFHHGDVNSSVYVGTYPRGAVREARHENPFAGTVEVTRQIVSKPLQEAQKRFPFSLHNGHKFYEIIRDRHTGKVRERLPAPSFLVIVPRAQRELGRFEER